MTYLDLCTVFSPRRSLVKLEPVISQLAEQKHAAVGIADFCNLYGSVYFYQACQKHNVKPIIGSKIFVVENLEEKTRGSSVITLLVQNEIGYKNLCKLITKAHLEGFYYIPRVNFNTLKQYNEGLVCISGIYGPQHEAMAKWESTKLDEHYYKILKQIYQDNLYISITPTSEPSQTDLYMADTYSDRLIVTCGTRFLQKEEWRYYAALDSARYRRQYKPDIALTNQRMHLLSDDEIFQYLAIHFPSTALKMIDRTDVIAAKCNFEFNKSYKFPHVGIDNPLEYIKTLANEGYKKIRSTISRSQYKVYKDRLRYELDVISKGGFVEYFLIVEDIVRWAKSQDIMVGPCRGSIGAALLGKCLGIHTIDPIKHGLYFERFLNPERVSMPDIDLDVEDTKRSQVVDYITKKYGADKTANIGNIGTLALKNTMKDVGKTLGFSFDKVNEYTQMVPFQAKTVRDCLTSRFDKRFKNTFQSDYDLRTIMKFTKTILGSMRQIGTHAAGVVIAPDDITNYTPLQMIKSTSGEHLTTQLNMKSLDAIGLIKFDILGLTALSTMHNCLNLVRETQKETLILEDIDVQSGEPAVFESIGKGHTTGIFQLGGQGITELAQQIKVKNFNELRDLIALYRPAVLSSKQEQRYIWNKFHPDDYKPVHSKLGSLLKDTQGVLVYQEQFMRASMDLAGFTASESDILRAGIGKKQKQLILQMKSKFIHGCISNNIPKQDAESIFSIFEDAVNYSFNRAHSTGYATISYWTALLKYKYPVEYMTSIFNSEIQNNDKFKVYVPECNRLGVTILPPNVNCSKGQFSIETCRDSRCIRYGLAAIKHVGDKAADHIAEIRSQGRFFSIFNFMERIDTDLVNKGCLLALAQSGSLDTLEKPREQIIGNITDMIKFYKSIKRKPGIFKPKPKLVEVEKMSPWEIINMEIESMGVSFE